MTREIALHCMKSASELERELCEECPIYGQTGCDHCYEDALQYVIATLEQEPTTKNCRSCRNFGSHHGICEICKDNKCWTEKEPTTKNDLGVDCIYRAELLKAMDTWDKFGNVPNVGLIPLRTFELQDRYVPYVKYEDMVNCVKNMSSVTSQEPKWIPTSERLPEKNMACLVATGRFNFTQIAVYSDLMGIIDHQIFYQGDVGHDNFKNITQYVKAWMPLPTSYREVEE